MHSQHLKIAFRAALVIIAIQVAIGVAAYYWLPDWTTRGQFGDVFGAANALFSGLAFAGLIYAILLQREDLELQRKELEMTRQELTRSAAAQEQSEIALRAQAEAASQSAKLSATNFLLDHYKAELMAMQGIAYMANDPRLARLHELERRTQVLVTVLDSMFNEVTSDGRQ